MKATTDTERPTEADALSDWGTVLDQEREVYAGVYGPNEVTDEERSLMARDSAHYRMSKEGQGA